MRMSWVIAGVILFGLCVLVLVPFIFGIPFHILFDGDAAVYSRVSEMILEKGFYSYDGIRPFIEREPGQSAWLSVIYFFFGIRNAWAIFLAQALLLLVAAYAFCRELAPHTSSRAAGTCFVLLLISGSALHTVFAAYREAMLLSVLLFFAALMLSLDVRRHWWKALLAGALLGITILTSYSFVFFPLFLLAVSLVRKKFLPALTVVIVGYALVGGWALRNSLYDGRFRVIDSTRPAAMWFVRGEQAEKLNGLEPLRCLIAEYVTRDWSKRSDACSFNRLMHERWPDDAARAATDYDAVSEKGQQKVLRHLPGYLWGSVFEVLELHLPYMGGGWSHAFNVFTALTMLILYIGFFAGIRSLLDRRLWLLTLLIVYNTLVFVLTDATPRYLVPILFCYAAIAGIGYDRVLARFYGLFRHRSGTQ